MNNIRLVIGDWSGDGHDKREVININSNLNEKELQKAYKAGVKQIGFDLLVESCYDYEDNHIEYEHCAMLSKSGLSIIDNFESGENFQKGCSISIYDPMEWVKLYLHFCKVGNPELKCEIVENPITIKIGGYGLFF